jgi:esterase
MSPAPSVSTPRADYDELVRAAGAAGIAAADVMLPANGWLDGDGLKLHYLEWPGPQPEPLVLMLHGGGLHAHSWDLVGLLLRHRARCVALDLRGHGDSDWSPGRDYTLLDHARDIAAAVEGLRAERVVVVAHSLGALASFYYAQHRLPELAGLVVVDVAPEFDRANGGRVSQFISSPVRFRSLDEAANYVRETVPSSRLTSPQSLANSVRITDEGNLAWKHDPGQFGSGGNAEQFRPQSMWAAVEQIGCPVLVLRGARSRVLSDEQAQVLADRVPDGRWARVPDAGHTIQTSNPRGLADAVDGFIASL